MSIKKFFAVPGQTTLGSSVLLVLRVVVGIAFIMHGFSKIQNPTGWMGPDSTVPAFFQLLAAVSEFGGGIALILGLLTPLACLGLVSTMAVAVYFHAFKFGDPFVATGPGQGSYEPAAVYLAMFLMFIGVGPGQFSADRFIFGQKSTIENSGEPI